MAVTYITYATGNAHTSTAKANFPSGGILVDDLLVLFVASKTLSATFSLNEAVPDDGYPVGDWTYRGFVDAGNGVTGVDDQGSNRMHIWTQIRQTEVPSAVNSYIQVLANGTTEGFVTGMAQYRKDPAKLWDIETAFVAMPSPTSTAQSIVTNFATAVSAGDEMLYLAAFNTDAYSFASYTTTLPAGITRGAITERRDGTALSGTQQRTIAVTYSVTGGSASGNFTLNTVSSGFVSGISPWGAAAALRIRDVSASSPVQTNFFAFF